MAVLLAPAVMLLAAAAAEETPSCPARAAAGEPRPTLELPPAAVAAPETKAPGPAPERSGELLLSLEEAVRLGREQSPRLRAGRARADAASAQALKGWRAVLPSVTGAEVYLATDHPFGALALTSSPFSVLGSAAAGGRAPSSVGAQDAFFTAVVVTQPIINVDGWLGMQAARKGARAAALGVEWAQAQLMLAVVQAYYALHVVAARSDALKTALAAAQQAVHQAEALHEEAQASPVDVYRARARVAQVRAELAHTDADRVSSQARLRSLLGIREPVTIVATDDLPRTSRLRAVPLQEALDTARGRQDLRSQELRLAAARTRLWSAWAAYVPRLNAVGAYIWQGGGPFSDQVDAWFAGAMLSWRPFAGMGTVAEIELRDAGVAEEQAHLEALRLRSDAEVRSAHAELQAARRQIHEAETELRQAGEARQLSQARYEEGVGPITELLDADASELDAALRLATARYDAAVAAARYRLAAGLLAPGSEP